MVNDFQRQLLADEIDEVSRSIERYQDAIAKLEHLLRVKNTRLHDLKIRKAKLEEGIDW